MHSISPSHLCSLVAEKSVTLMRFAVAMWIQPEGLYVFPGSNLQFIIYQISYRATEPHQV